MNGQGQEGADCKVMEHEDGSLVGCSSGGGGGGMVEPMEDGSLLDVENLELLNREEMTDFQARVHTILTEMLKKWVGDKCEGESEGTPKRERVLAMPQMAIFAVYLCKKIVLESFPTLTSFYVGAGYKRRLIICEKSLVIRIILEGSVASNEQASKGVDPKESKIRECDSSECVSANESLSDELVSKEISKSMEGISLECSEVPGSSGVDSMDQVVEPLPSPDGECKDREQELEQVECGKKPKRPDQLLYVPKQQRARGKSKKQSKRKETNPNSKIVENSNQEKIENGVVSPILPRKEPRLNSNLEGASESDETVGKGLDPLGLDCSKTDMESKEADIVEETFGCYQPLPDENWSLLTSSQLRELNTVVGSVDVYKATWEDMAYDVSITMDDSSTGHLLEAINIPSEYKTDDLISLFTEFRKNGYKFEWVGDNLAVGVFSCSSDAAEALLITHPFMKLRPIQLASKETKNKIRGKPSRFLPFKHRPPCLMSAAKRMISSSLGIRRMDDPASLEREKEILDRARVERDLKRKEKREMRKTANTDES